MNEFVGVETPVPVVDWRGKDDDWSMSKELEEMGFENVVDSIMILNSTFLGNSHYEHRFQTFVEGVCDWLGCNQDPELKPHLIYAMDNGFAFQVLIERTPVYV